MNSEDLMHCCKQMHSMLLIWLVITDVPHVVKQSPFLVLLVAVKMLKSLRQKILLQNE